MSFLELNGMTIPTLKGGRRADRVIGEVSTAFSGDRLVDQRAIKEDSRFTVKPSQMQLIQTIRGLLLGLGDAFLFDGDAYSSKGAAPDSGAANVIYRQQQPAVTDTVEEEDVLDSYGNLDAKFTECAELANAYTNELIEQVRTGGDGSSDTTSFAQIGTPATFEYVTDIAWEGAGCIHVVTDAVNEGVETDPVAIATTTIYEGTVYVYCGIAETIRVRLVANNSGGGSWVSLSHPGGGWHRIRAVHTTDGVDAVMVMQIDATDSGTNFWVDGLQIVVTGGAAYPHKGWANAAAVKSDLNMPVELLNGWRDLTVAMWVLADGDNGATRYLLHLVGAHESNLQVYRTTGSTQLTVRGVGADGDTLSADVASCFTADEWVHIAITLRRYPTGTENGLEVYRNGVLASSDADTPLDLSGLEGVIIGNSDDGTKPLEGRIDELIFLPYVAHADLITAIAGSRTWGWPSLPKVRASGDFIDTESVEVTGSTKDHTYMGLSIDGAHVNNLRELEFELFEE